MSLGALGVIFACTLVGRAVSSEVQVTAAPSVSFPIRTKDLPMTLRLVAGTIADADVAGPLRFVGRVDLSRVEVNTTRPLVAFHGMLRLARGAVIAVREVEAGTLRGTLFDPWLPELALPCHALGIAIAEADSSGPTFPRVDGAPATWRNEAHPIAFALTRRRRPGSRPGS